MYRGDDGGGSSGAPSRRLRPLQHLDAPRPVLAQEPRERTIGEQATVRLTARAVVGLVVRVADALHGRAAHGARLSIAAVHRHPFAEGGYLRRKAVARLGAEPLGPFGERR